MNKEKLYEIINPGIPYNENNLRFQEMLYMINTSNIPKQVIGTRLTPDDTDYDKFVRLANIQDNIAEFVTSGSNLYLYSQTCGNGKTTWSIKLLLQYFNEVWACNNFRVRGLFINVPTFLTKIKTVIGRPDDEFERLREEIDRVDVVVWDDIASTKLSDFDYNTLLTYIDKRTLEGKCNIYTGNIIPSDLDKYVGQRLSSRILNHSTLIELRGKDRRKSW
jgi:DNA replication protein DnaC